ncbi:STAS domain-containing protein [Streptantibioticus ferralitis]|uniref:Anti-sigma factor antagonist n=1 Tax=Streptantibioticus ferralitis TaxID=236510 RepID=A0ABT5Z0H7_9ACTN|nr:STAS domain-containing protein [Streptantibioticus ferralitis]MDF2257214.1 STAS domain-containing protein [Streptantibioticus ferralitis]
MAPEGLTTEVTASSAGHALVTVRGELDIETTDQLRSRLLQVVAENPESVVDLSGVSFCDCSGLSALDAARRAAIHAGRSLRLRAVPPTVARVLAATGMDTAFAIDDAPTNGR